MRGTSLLLAASLLVTAVSGASASPTNPTSLFLDLPLTFEENLGQAGREIEYLSRGPGYGLFLSKSEILFALGGGGPDQTAQGIRMQLVGSNPDPSGQAIEPVETRTHYYLGNDPDRWITGVPHTRRVLYSEVYPGIDLVLYGTQGQLEYDFIVSPGASWEQIRLRFEGTEELSLSPRGELILKLQSGELVQRPPVVYQETPGGERLSVEGSYVLAGSGQVAFRVGAYDPTRPLIIDPVIIYLGYLGGSDYTDDPYDIASDSTGAAYVTGQTCSSGDFPVGNVTTTITTWQGSGCDAYVAKIAPAGDAIVWAAFFGGSSSFGEWGNSIAVDASQQVYFCGSTDSTDLPTANAYQSTLEGSEDAFVAQLSSDGTSLLYSTYLGGATAPSFSFYSEACNGIDVDSGLIYVGGTANTSDFDTAGAGAYDTTGPLGSNGTCPTCYEDRSEDFIAVFNPSLTTTNTLVYATFLGSEQGSDIIYDLAVIAAGEVAVTGSTTVELTPQAPGRIGPAGKGPPPAPFPTSTDAFQSVFAGGFNDAFVTRLDTTAMPASAVIYSTLFGGTDFDDGHAVDVLSDNAFVLGSTDSTDFPTTSGVHKTSNTGGDSDLFIAKFDTTGPTASPIAPAGPGSTTLIYSTLYGGTDFEGPGGIAVNSAGEACIMGETSSSDLTLVNEFQSTFFGDVESPDLAVAKLNSTATSLIFSSYLGGAYEEFATGGVALNPDGGMLIAATSATDFLGTTGSFNPDLTDSGSLPNRGRVPSGTQTVFGNDGIVALIAEPADLDIMVTDSPDPVFAGANLTYSVTVHNSGPADADNTTVTVQIYQSSFVSSTGGCIDNSGLVTCNVGTLVADPGPEPAPAGGVSMVSFDLVIQPDSFFDGSSMEHDFDVSSDRLDTDLLDNSVTVDTMVDFSSDVVVTKTDEFDPVTQGDSFDYTVSITNNGPSGTYSVDFTDSIPAEVIFNSSVPDDQSKICFYDPKSETLDCYFGDMDSGDMQDVTINVTAGTGPATATNSVTVTHEMTDPVPANNTAVTEQTTILGQPDLTVGVVDDPDPVVAGNNLTYNVTVTNGGTAFATSSVLDVTLDSGLTYVSGSAPPLGGASLQGTVVCTPSGQDVSCDLGTIPAQGSKPVSIVATVSSAQTSTLSSQFDASTTDTESDDQNNGAMADTTVTTEADLSITKSDSPDPVITGQTLTYMLTPTNNGPSDATFVFVTDTLPAGTTFLSSTPSICSEDGDIFCNIGSLTAGQSSPFSIDVTVTAPPGQISNTASVEGSQTDPQSENDSAVEMTTVDPDVIADLSVGVADVPDPVDAGTDLTYNVTVMNEGTGEATTSVLDVTLDPALSFVSASGPPPARTSIQGGPL